MKRTTALLLGSCLFVGGLGIAAAQEPPPKILTIQREFIKPGKNGAVHEKSESAFVQAMTRAKWPTHYFAVNALSGKSRALFLTGYDSFEAWEKDMVAEQKNPTLSAALDRASLADGDLLTEFDASALMYRDDYSLNSTVDIAHMRYFEISLYRVRPGHDGDWDSIVKLVKAAYQKMPDIHWVMYQAVYGQEGNTYIIFWPMKTGADIDRSFANDKQFVSAMGEDGMKKLSELSASSIEFFQHNLFAFSPAMSYPPDEWIKADPDFWKPKATHAAAPKKAEEKPAQ
jgi:hypothetical protein